MCGLAGIVSLKNKKEINGHFEPAALNDMVIKIQEHNLDFCKKNNVSFDDHYLGGKNLLDALWQEVRSLKRDDLFINIFTHNEIQGEISTIGGCLYDIIRTESRLFSEQMGHLSSHDADIASQNIEQLKDIAWCLTKEITDNVKEVRDLFLHANSSPYLPSAVNIFKKINAVLNSIDRLEVRGRDSAGISLMFILDVAEFEKFRQCLDKANLLEQLEERSGKDILENMGISICDTAIDFTYKTAAEIGSLGDNVAFLRGQIKSDDILQTLVNFPHQYHTVLSHTRWASVGAISEPNCHPVDNKAMNTEQNGIIHVCLNGDIDNYLQSERRI